MSDIDKQKVHLQWFADEPEPKEPDVVATDTPDDSKLNIELITKELDSNEDLKNNVYKFFRPDIDREVTKASKTIEQNIRNKQSEENEIEIERLYGERHPEETPGAKLQRQNAKEIADLKRVNALAKESTLLVNTANNYNLKIPEEFITNFTVGGKDQGDEFIKWIADIKKNAEELGKKKTLSKHASTPQTGEIDDTEIPAGKLVQAFQAGKISLSDYQKRLTNLK